MVKNKAQGSLLAASLREARCQAARLVEEQALLDSQLVAMDGQFFLERRNEYPSEVDRAAYVARERRDDPAYSSLHRKSLSLERELAEARAKQAELAVLLLLEVAEAVESAVDAGLWRQLADINAEAQGEMRDWDEVEDSGLKRSEISAALSAEESKIQFSQDMAKSEPGKTETYIRGKALLEDIETFFQHE